MVLHSPSNMESNQSRSSSRYIGGSQEKYPPVHNDHIYVTFYQDFIVLAFISLLHVGMTQSARAKLPLSQVSHHLPCSHSSLLATLLRWRLFKARASKFFIWQQYFCRKLRGRKEAPCLDCSGRLTSRPRMSDPELPILEAPEEEEEEEEVKITAEEMANMAVSSRPHTQVKKHLLPTSFSTQTKIRWTTSITWCLTSSK